MYTYSAHVYNVIKYNKGWRIIKPTTLLGTLKKIKPYEIVQLLRRETICFKPPHSDFIIIIIIIINFIRKKSHNLSNI